MKHPQLYKVQFKEPQQTIDNLKAQGFKNGEVLMSTLVGGYSNTEYITSTTGSKWWINRDRFSVWVNVLPYKPDTMRGSV